MKYISLSNSHLCAIVDDDAFNLVIGYNWGLVEHKGGLCYAQVTINGTNVRMHRLILAATDRFDVDHKNGNGLDNRKENLRLATRSQNTANSRKSSKQRSSKYKGVSYQKNVGWKAEITVAGKRYYLGCFSSESDAAREYNRAALKHFGEFARLNELGDPLVGSEEKS